MEITVDADPTMTSPTTQRRPTSTKRRVDIEIGRPATRRPWSLVEPDAAEGARRGGRTGRLLAAAVAVDGVTVVSWSTRGRAHLHGPTPVALPKSVAPSA